MIYDLLEYFKVNPNSEQMVLDNYLLKSGLYIRFNQDGPPNIIKVDKKDQAQGDIYKWFRDADYYSYVSDTNKCFDVPKKVMHNDNYLTLFFKTKSLLENKMLKPDFQANVKNFYDKMIKKLQSKDVMDFAAIAQLPSFRKEQAEKHMEIILEKVDWIVQSTLQNELSDNDYVKIFFEEDLAIYQNEYIRYYYPYIFNKNDFNIKYGDTVYGLSAANMGLNVKKPFLEHKTTNFKVPFRVSLEDAMEAKKLFEWLATQQTSDGKPMSAGYINVQERDAFLLEDRITSRRNMHYVHLEKGTDTIIDDYDFLPGIEDEIDKFMPENYLMVEYYEAGATSSRMEMEKLVDRYLYDFKLARNYRTQPKDIKGLSSRLLNLLLLSRKAMEDFFRKGDDSAIKYSIDKITAGLIREKLNEKETKFFTNTGQALNMRFALLKYFRIGGKEDMSSIIGDTWSNINKKINSKALAECENDIEFYFASGQLVRYIISQSEAKELKHNMINPLANAKNTARFKEEMKVLYHKYSHSFKFTDRFNNLLSMVMGYFPDNGEINYDIFLAGLASRNMMYETKEGHNHENEK